MSCDQNTSRGGSDNLEVIAGTRLFDESDMAWLLGQAMLYLNTADKQGELAYTRVIEILRRSDNILLETVNELFRHIRSGDTPLLLISSTVISTHILASMCEWFI